MAMYSLICVVSQVIHNQHQMAAVRYILRTSHLKEGQSEHESVDVRLNLWSQLDLAWILFQSPSIQPSCCMQANFCMVSGLKEYTGRAASVKPC